MTLPSPPAPEPSMPVAALGVLGPGERIGGGYETDVYRSGDGRFVLKLKRAAAGPIAALALARRLDVVARTFQRFLGPRHSLPSDYVVVPAGDGRAYVLGVQPFLAGAHPLDTVDLAALSAGARVALARQLWEITEGALACYGATGCLPDLYGLGPHLSDRVRRRDHSWMLTEGWSLVAGSPLLNAHNLMLCPQGHVVLVDYDPLCTRSAACGLIYGARALLLLRDRRQLAGLLGA